MLKILHFVFSFASYMYVQTEVLRKDTKELMSNFREGVAIFDQNTGILTFASKVAKRFNISQKKE